MVITPIVIFLLLIDQGDLSSAGRPGLFWVAADKAQCSNYSNDSDCDTLAGYHRRKVVNFSLSDTTWIFLHGEHWENCGGSNLAIVGARNVTLKGEEKCAMGSEKCIIHIIVSKYTRAGIHVKQSSDITFEQLIVRTKGMYVTQTNNFNVYSVNFLNTAVSITDPGGNYTLMESLFSPMSYIYTELHTCPNTSEVSCNFTFTINQCKLEMKRSEINLAVGMTRYHSIKITITNSTFIRSQLYVFAINYPLCSLTVEVKLATFIIRGIYLNMPLIRSTTHPEAADEWLGAHVHIHNCSFNMTLQIAIDIRLRPSSHKDSRRVTSQYPEIIISNSNFQHGKPTYFLSQPYALRAEITDNMSHIYHLHEARHRILLTILHNKIESRFAALELRNLQGYRVLLAEGNQIVSNGGFGLLLNNTQVELQGYNEISTNNVKGSAVAVSKYANRLQA